MDKAGQGKRLGQKVLDALNGVYPKGTYFAPCETGRVIVDPRFMVCYRCPKVKFRKESCPKKCKNRSKCEIVHPYDLDNPKCKGCKYWVKPEDRW